MPHRTRRRRRAPHRAATAVLVAVLAASAGCSTAEPVTTPTSPSAAAAPARPAPAPEPAVPDVPVRSSGLDAAVVPSVVPPVGLAVPALDITLPLDPVGVTDDGQMEIPPLAERGGWYRFGASPADASGTAVVAAHVDSVASAGLGPFARLPDAAVGDVVDVTLADGSTRQYTVVDVARQAKPEVAWADVFTRGGPHRLVLVTCGGTFQRDVGHYSDNVIVTAEPVGA
ncbi:class F sortase [uncultured Cellulomonas sp.]|uniref:class F sortase n=1 Tax=uncultured Cellulomonas sp. TaxID=189682 RepID=UPI00263472F7|nr:class F sortase [uncultured Cellulomonas sp.]